MRVLLISPVSTEDNSLTYAVRNYLLHHAQLNGLQVFYSTHNASPDNSIMVVSANISNSISAFLYKNFRLPKTIRKYQPTVVVDTVGLTSAKSYKQFQVVSPSFYNRKNAKFLWEKNAFANRGKILNDNNRCMTASNTIVKILEKEMQLSRASVLKFAMPFPQKSIDWQQTEAIKNQITGGSEMFYSDARFASKEEIMNLLRSFSVFKKWQQSAMHLVIRMQSSNALQDELSNYKFRGDVLVVQDDDALPGAYVVVQPYTDVNAFVIEQASLMNIAAITVPSDDLPTIQSEIFLSVENAIEHVGQAMIALYKNEQRRNNLASAAKDHYSKVDSSTLAEIIAL